MTVGVVGAGVAYANVGFSVPSPTGLSDGQSVQVVLNGINAVALATVDISECANAYTDNTALPTQNLETDCQVVAHIDVSSTPSLTTNVTVTQSGVGMGNRSCISGGNFSCDLRISEMKNQLTSPLPPPVAISFAGNPPPGTPDQTTTTVSETGAPAVLGKTAYAHVAVASLGDFVPEGNTTGRARRYDVATAPIGTNGTVNVPLGTPDLGSHTVAARFDGNGSFAASTATTTSFEVIAATNISVGDWRPWKATPASARSRSRSCCRSRRSCPSPSTTQWTRVRRRPATTPSSEPVRATLKFGPGITIKFVLVKINGDTLAEGNETFSIDLSSPTTGWDLRRNPESARSSTTIRARPLRRLASATGRSRR